jgi:alkylhydroperoxidase family enzyme
MVPTEERMGSPMTREYLLTGRISIPTKVKRNVSRQLSQLESSRGRRLAIYEAMAVHPELMKGFSEFGSFFLSHGLMIGRERELLILRTAWRLNSEYEFAQHRPRGLSAGLSEEEIERTTESRLLDWNPRDRRLLSLADELLSTDDISDETWSAMSAEWHQEQIMEVIVLIGFYRLVASFAKATRVPLEHGLVGWPPAGAAGPV